MANAMINPVNGMAGIKYGDGMTKSFEPLDGKPVYDFSANLREFFDFLSQNGKLNGSHLSWMWAGVETGGNATYDTVQGTLSTTEWTISSPDAPAPVRNAPRFRRSVRHPASYKAPHVTTAIRGRERRTGLPYVARAYSLRGERLPAVARDPKRAMSNGAYVVR